MNGSLGIIGALLGALALSEAAQAGPRERDVDHLPMLDSISFSASAVGFTAQRWYGSTPRERWFVLERAADVLHEVAAAEFAARFPDGLRPKAVLDERRRDSRDVEVLATSTGQQAIAAAAYCSEGERSVHRFWLDGREIALRVEPCMSVHAVEIAEGRLWLGTRVDGEYGPYPGKGVVVQGLADGRLVGVVDTSRGLSSNLVWAVRSDPYTGSLWVTTQLGIDEITRDLRVRRSLYLFEDFEPETGALRVRVSTTPCASAPLASFFDALEVRDPRAFRAAISHVPRDMQRQFVEALRDSLDGPADTYGEPIESAFAPRELNVLLPFVIEAARSPNADLRYTGLRAACHFYDAAIPELLHEIVRADPVDLREVERDAISRCLRKYRRLENARRERGGS